MRFGNRGLAAARIIAGVSILIILLIIWRFNYVPSHDLFPAMAIDGGADPETVNHITGKIDTALKGMAVVCLLIIFSGARTDDHPSNIRRY